MATQPFQIKGLQHKLKEKLYNSKEDRYQRELHGEQEGASPVDDTNFLQFSL